MVGEWGRGEGGWGCRWASRRRPRVSEHILGLLRECAEAVLVSVIYYYCQYRTLFTTMAGENRAHLC